MQALKFLIPTVSLSLLWFFNGPAIGCHSEATKVSPLCKNISDKSCQILATKIANIPTKTTGEKISYSFAPGSQVIYKNGIVISKYVMKIRCEAEPDTDIVVRKGNTGLLWTQNSGGITLSSLVFFDKKPRIGPEFKYQILSAEELRDLEISLDAAIAALKR